MLSRGGRLLRAVGFAPGNLVHGTYEPLAVLLSLRGMWECERVHIQIPVSVALLSERSEPRGTKPTRGRTNEFYLTLVGG